MVDVVSQLPRSGPMAQVRRLGSKVGSRLALFCVHRVKRVNSRNDFEKVLKNQPKGVQYKPRNNTIFLSAGLKVKRNVIVTT